MSKKNNILVIVSSVITAFVLSVFVISPVFADIEQQTARIKNCSSYISPKNTTVNTFLDDSRGVLIASYNVNDLDFTIELPYIFDKNLGNCSKDAQGLLKHVKEVSDSLKADLCKDFKAIIDGEKPLSERNGVKANMAGAIDFVNTDCKK